ncbi:MAG: hypothetical protein P3W87_008650 [Gammaproteobacteria bacterium]|nr:hypothetical protein [Gammaproteobacteria bacterium]
MIIVDVMHLKVGWPILAFAFPATHRASPSMRTKNGLADGRKLGIGKAGPRILTPMGFSLDA